MPLPRYDVYVTGLRGAAGATNSVNNGTAAPTAVEGGDGGATDGNSIGDGLGIIDIFNTDNLGGGM